MTYWLASPARDSVPASLWLPIADVLAGYALYLGRRNPPPTRINGLRLIHVERRKY
jgi:hypothetical protein